MPIFNINKPLGKTPLQVLDQLRLVKPELKYEKMSYAGRLDPMAEGVMMVMVGEDVYKRDAYMGLIKTYEARFLFGFSTDTYDALGLITGVSENAIEKREVKNALKSLKGELSIPFPAYSSFKVKGKPLVFWAREGRLDEIEIPLKTMEVFSIGKIKIKKIVGNNLLNEIKEKINLVEGDFRQLEIIKGWEEKIGVEKIYFTAIMTLEVSSGTYIRSLANKVGLEIGCGALLLELKRTKVGEHSLKSSANIF